MNRGGVMLLILLILSIAGSILSIVMLQGFMNSEYVSGNGNVPGRYTSGNLLCLFFGGLLGPISTLGVFDCLDMVVNVPFFSTNIKKASVFMVVLASLASFIVGYSHWHASDLILCGFFFCSDQTTSAHGSMISTGLVYCVISLVVMAQCVKLVLTIKHKSNVTQSVESNSDQEPLLVSDSPTEALSSQPRQTTLLFVTLTFFLAFFILSSTLPPGFSYIDPANIAQTIEAPITGAEEDDAWLRTINIKLGSSFYMHIFPDTALYYSLLSSLALIGYFRSIRVVRLIALPVVFSQVIFFVIYWVQSHLWQGYVHAISDPEVIARCTGQIALYVMALLILPVSRTSPFHTLFNVSWEAMVEYHIYCGYLFLALVATHVISWAVKFVDLGFGLHDLFSLKWYYPNDGADKSAGPQSDNFTDPLVLLNVYLLFVCMGLLSLWRVRRKFFEIFYHAHMVTFLSLTVAVFWHASSAWYYLAPSVTLYIIDRWSRSSSTFFGTASKTVYEFSDSTITKLKISFPYMSSCPIKYLKRGNFNASPGQYVLLNVPSISAVEWHPFTLSDSSSLELHIKADGGFTRSLAELASEKIEVAIMGPYGLGLGLGMGFGVLRRTLHRRSDDAGAKSLVLVGGGIGITPCVSVLRGLLKENLGFNSIKLIWVVRERSTFAIFEEFLSSTIIHRPFVEVELYSTRPVKDLESVPSTGWTINDGRPDLMRSIKTNEGDFVDVHVFACGPRPLVESARSASKSNNYTFHTETFEL